MVTNFKFKI